MFSFFLSHKKTGWIAGFLLAVLMAFCLRMLEWPSWQNPEYRFGDEMLLATHDAYHWLAGACGFGRAKDHPMAQMLILLSEITGCNPAQIAFWLPAVFASLAGGAVFLWGKLVGNTAAGLAAGLIATISPGFLGRTLLGYYDTDLVTLLFPLLVSFLPALWLIKISDKTPVSEDLSRLSGLKSPQIISEPYWSALLALSGLAAWWTQEWHSVFPYLIRYDVFLIFCFVCFIRNSRILNFGTALCFVLPALAGYVGLIWFIIWWAGCSKPYQFLCRYIQNKWLIFSLWLFAFFYFLQGEILNTLVNQVNAYLKHAAEVHISGVSALNFPSVAQSIVEVQDLAFLGLFPYFHPWLEAAVVGFAAFLPVLWKRPVTLLLLPFAALGILSTRMGGRMVMFGAPIMALGISLSCFWLIHYFFKRWLKYNLAAWINCLLLCCVLILPFLDMIPAMSQGPVINRRHAQALAQAGNLTPNDSILWLWWDWGYAAHYFARRHTIADGAMHGGPSLYLPAAVFATANPRFARQIIARTSQYDNEPGNFFKNMTSEEAQQLINSLALPDTPLVPAKGSQYLVVSFEMLKLGFWISNFGNWNFILASGEGGALSIVPEGVSYRLKAGEVRLEGRSGVIYPASINIFAETGLTVKDYIREWFLNHPRATVSSQKTMLAGRRNINFLFNRVTDEKLAMDQGIYDSLMVQLLVCDANDPRFTPYFRLVYDNIFARIYEILPLPGSDKK